MRRHHIHHHSNCNLGSYLSIPLSIKIRWKIRSLFLLQVLNRWNGRRNRNGWFPIEYISLKHQGNKRSINKHSSEQRHCDSQSFFSNSRIFWKSTQSPQQNLKQKVNHNHSNSSSNRQSSKPNKLNISIPTISLYIQIIFQSRKTLLITKTFCHILIILSLSIFKSNHLTPTIIRTRRFHNISNENHNKSQKHHSQNSEKYRTHSETPFFGSYV